MKKTKIVVVFLLALFLCLEEGTRGKESEPPSLTTEPPEPSIIMTGSDAWLAEEGWEIFDGKTWQPVEEWGGFWRAAGTSPLNVFYRHSDWRWPDGWQLDVFIGTTVLFCGPKKCLEGEVANIFTTSNLDTAEALRSCGTEAVLLTCEGNTARRRAYCISLTNPPPGWGDW